MGFRADVKLTLRNEGWARLDFASTTVRGESARIIDYMQEAIDEGVVVSLCKQLGICSAGFLFHDAIKNKTRFFRLNKMPPTYKTRYLWNDDRPHQDWSDCVHWLFVYVRQIQYRLRRRGNPRAEDYFANLPLDDNDDDDRALGPEGVWRRSFGIHYCTVGEMLYTAFVWRFLSVARDSGWGTKYIRKTRVRLEHRSCTFSPCIWRGESVVDQDDVGSNETRDNVELFRQLWGRRIGPRGSWREEWRALLLAVPDAQFQTTTRTAVIRFLKGAGFIDTAGIVNLHDDVAVNEILQNAVPKFLRWLSGGANVCSVNRGLQVLESCARFPILPFYMWNALNGAPVCYAVVPIWTSQNHCIKMPTGRCHHLGLALTGVRPMRRLDWTSHGLAGLRSSEAEPLVTINVLRLMARPLVEWNLYHWLWREKRGPMDASMNQAIRRDLGHAS